MSLIELRDVSKLYGFGEATVLALDEVNLTIEQGEFVAVMGPSGCGKSTLMNIIGMLDSPTNGTYNLHSRSSVKLSPKRLAKIRRDEVGFIFQFYNLLPNLTVIENVALPLFYRGVGYIKRLKTASEMLERVGLREREYYMPRHLSGGQIQSVAIARALINNPQIIIADEPTGNLDSSSSRLILELLSEIHKSGRTILLVTHNPEITRYANRVVYMHDGTIVRDEQTKIGDVAPTALREMYHLTTMTEEDDLAGVSVLMNLTSDIQSATKAKTRPKKKAKSTHHKSKKAKPRRKVSK
jgi:putative ABC transport system ATP-binding protein